ncbi:beta-1,3-galactosyltransferase 1-like [Argopecten irradians]|uniref:beta-1,3-galactosyltransferase 1-like n=1 Tax=Argopecten irradians TaxID=31199 RepID=UPI003714A1E5
MVTSRWTSGMECRYVTHTFFTNSWRKWKKRSVTENSTWTERHKTKEADASVNLTFEPPFTYYMPSIHPLHIDLRTLVQRHIKNGVPFPVSPINPHPYKYIHRPPQCEFNTSKDNLTIMVLIKSYTKHSVQRYAIRETWGKANLYPNVKVAFLLAEANNFQRYVESEVSLYNDVIQEDFTDNYWNNTIKTIMGFNWVTSYCPTAKIVIFADDDHLLHMGNIMAFLRRISSDKMKTLYAGYLIEDGLVNRGKNSSTIPVTEYPYPTWPPYLRGGSFLMSLEVAKSFATAFPYVKSLPVDDAYLGIVAYKLNIAALHDNRFMQKRERLKRYRKTHFSFNDYKTRERLVAAWNTISLPDTAQFIKQKQYIDKSSGKSRIRISNKYS